MSMHDRYYWRTLGYHVWGIFKRHDNNMTEGHPFSTGLDKLIETVGARGRGDNAARQHCRDTVASLNAGTQG